jgi:hypothetical protein
MKSYTMRMNNEYVGRIDRLSAFSRWRWQWSRGVAVLALICGAGPAMATPLISEVFYDASGSDDGKVFVELSGVPGTLLDGLVVEGVNGSNGATGPSLTLTGVIGADGLFVLADLDGGGLTAVPGADLLLNFDFQNGPDSVVLRDGPIVLDAVGYGAFGVGDIFAGEGAAAPDGSAGSSLSRVFANLDTNDNATDFEVLTTPTPGFANFLPVPEPGTAPLAATGLGVLAGLRRRARCAKAGLAESR